MKVLNMRNVIYHSNAYDEPIKVMIKSDHKNSPKWIEINNKKRILHEAKIIVIDWLKMTNPDT